MGKVGFLPDISHNFGYFKNLAVNNLQRKDYAGATGAMYNLNGCLGEEYLVSISNKEYDNKIKETLTYQCNHCTTTEEKIIHKGEDNEYTKEIQVPTEIPSYEIEVFNGIVSLVQQVIIKSKIYCNQNRIYIPILYMDIF